MKKIFCLVCFFLALFSLKSIADVPEGAIPFVFDGHLYLQSTLNDTIPVTLIYDTGADFLYLDEDYLKLNHLQNAFGRKGKATMGGAGNGEPERIDIFIDPITVHCGAREYQNEITPIIKLRDLLGRHTDGLLGNTHLLMNPLEINFSESYLRQLKGPLLAEQLDNYVKLDARFEDNRIDVKATLQIDDENSLEGWFRMDLGCGSTIILTMATVDRTDICGGWIVNGLYKGGVAEQAGIEIGDIIVAINNRPVKEITWEEQRKGLELQGETTYTVQKPDGQIVSYTLFIGKQII